MPALDFHAGPLALERLRTHGLQAADIAAIPAAAGGPKGLIFLALDQWLFGDWLPAAPRERTLIGASIGAWRMAAACHADPAAAFRRLAELYCSQRYPKNPPPTLVSELCAAMLNEFAGSHVNEILAHPTHRLHVLASRGSGALAAPATRRATIAGFTRAVVANAFARSCLSAHLERVVIGDTRDTANWLRSPFDAFATHFAPLSSDNLMPALLASATLPMIMAPVTQLPGAPPGSYWDGGLVDYHLALPYRRLADADPDALVLYPHFSADIVPGWFDKPLRWRRAARGRERHWLDNVLVVSPSREFLDTLPNRKLPDRKDFTRYDDDALRMRHWQIAMREGERLRDELTAFAMRPDLPRVKRL